MDHRNPCAATRSAVMPGDGDYQMFRAELDRLYPGAAARIALSRGELAHDPTRFAADLHAQIAPHILQTAAGRVDSYQIGINYEYKVARTLRNPVGNICLSLHADSVDIGAARKRGNAADPLAPYAPPAGDAAFCYIALNRDMSPRTQLQRMSDRSIHPLRMKFAQAAMNPDHMKWWSFYHELAHALIATGHYDTGRKDGPAMRRIYAYEMEESICDSYASIMTLQRFGAPCVPMLRTMADMRRSLFPQSGPHYYTAPALYAVISAFESGTPHPASTGPDAAFAMALATARTHYLPYDDFAAGFLRLKAEEEKIFMRLTPAMKARLRTVVAECYAGAALPDEQRNQAHRDAARRLAEGEAVLGRDYKNTLPGTAFETGARWIKMPLHRLGWIPHPGY